MSKKYFSLRTVGLLSIAATIGFLSTGSQVSAASNYNLISNAVYLNKNSMSRAQIQNFLESKGSKLATYKDQGPNETKKELASYLIWHAAQIWSINPQVILATLQKEQSLITNPNPSSIALRSAMGYDCPDSSACNSLYYGFANQVNMATYQFRYNYEALKGNSSFVDIDGDVHGVGQYACNGPTHFYNNALRPGNTVTFKRNTAISGTKDKTVKIANEATASLLCYTPHVGPLSETGYSGSDNFVYWFKQWFGSTHYSIRGSIKEFYDKNNGPALLGEPLQNEKTDGKGMWWQRFDKGYIAGQSNTGYYAVKGSIGKHYTSHNGPSTLGKPLSKETLSDDGVWSQPFAQGYIAGKSDSGYFSIRGSIAVFFKKYDGLARFGQPLSAIVGLGSGVWEQKFKNGYVIGSKDRYYKTSPSARTYWLNHGGHGGRLGLPTSSTSSIGSGEYQTYKGGALFGNNDTGYYALMGSIGAKYLSNTSGIFARLGFPIENEKSVGSGAWSQRFENGYIAGSRGRYYVTSEQLYTYWINHGAQEGRLGLPRASSYSIGDGEYQQYQGGIVIGSDSTGYYAVKGSIGTKYLSDLNNNFSKLGFPIENEQDAGNGQWKQVFEKGYIIGSRANGYTIIEEA